jgi:hypothetical protein
MTPRKHLQVTSLLDRARPLATRLRRQAAEQAATALALEAIADQAARRTRPTDSRRRNGGVR